MGMEIDTSELIHSLSDNEINTLLMLYYNKERIIQDSEGFNINKETFDILVEKNLISTDLTDDENIVSLTDEGLTVCGSVMFERINLEKDLFLDMMKTLPERAIACLINRVMWKDINVKESGYTDPVTKPYALDESHWYERILLKDSRITELLEQFYGTLEDFGLVRNMDNQRWCSPEVENFLKEEYKNIMDLTWSEEDSLKYYYFFYMYAQDQKNLINFSGEGEEYRSQFFGEDTNPSDYWLSSNRSDPRSLLTSIGISEQRVLGFLQEMQTQNIVTERYYPLTSSSFFSEEDKIFVIQDIKNYLKYITDKLLAPIVDSLLSTNR